MLLTLSQPGKTEFGFRPSHSFPSPTLHSGPHYRHSPKPSYEHPESSLPVSNHYAMSTSHRGLPPPAAMTLPEPNRPHGSSLQSTQQPLGPMPAPPNQWQGAEDSMRNWLNTKAEEERRKAEEEKTRQETLKLEQRRVEHSMLRDSMSGGIPPQMIPIIFAGIGGTNTANASLDWLQQYATQLQASQQQLQTLDINADSRREPRMINPSQPPYAQQPQQQQQQPQPQQQQQPPPPPPPGAPVQHPPPLSQHQSTFPAYPAENRGAPSGPTSAPRSAGVGLSRLNTVDLPQQQSSSGPGSAHPRQADPPNSSPSIYFHHWVPPQQHQQESKSTQPPTPSGRNDPGSAHPSHVGENDFRDSPRKRKATGAHQAPPAPSQISPSFSNPKDTRRHMPSGHNRSRSQKSNEGQSSDRQTPSRRDSVAAPRSSYEGHRDEHSRPPTQSGPSEIR